MASLAFLISEVSQVRGADVTWDGSQNNQWSQAKNWSPEAEPDTGDTAIFAAPVASTQPTVNKAASVLGVAFTGTGGWTLGSGNTLTVGTGGIDQTGSGVNTVAAAVALGAASTWTVNSGTLVVSGVVSGGFALTKDGAGILSMSGANTYTGATTISAGILSANTLANGASNSSIGASGTAAANLVFNGGTLRYTGANVTTNRLFTLTQNGGAIEANGTGTVTLGNAAAIAFSGNGARTLTLTGTNTGNNTLTSIVGDGSGGATSLVKNGAGTWRLSGVNTYSGGTTINSGTLQSTAANRLSTSGAITVNGGTFDLGTFNQSTSGNVTIAGGVVTNGTLTKTAGNFAAQSGTASATLTGAAGLVKTTAGTFVLSASNSYSGGTTVDAGTLQFATAGNRLSTSGDITVNGGTFNLGSFNQSTSGAVTIAGGVVTNGTLTKTAGNFAAQSGTASAILTGAAGLVKTTAGTFVVSASNSYSGGTTVDAGTLQFATAGNRLSTSGNITVNGGTLDLGGFGQSTSGNVTIAGGTVSNGTLTKVGGSFSAQSGSVAANGVLAGTGVGFQKTTASLFTLNGNHTYTGATEVNAGTLIVNGSIASSSGVVVASGATLGGHGIVSKISGAGTVSPGESPSILTAASVDGSDGLDFRFEFTNAAIAGISAPDFLDVDNDSGNDLLRITDSTPFTFALNAGNTVTVDFSLVTLNVGDRYLGGFYTQANSLASISGADYDYIGLGEYGVTVSMVQWTADFGGGPVNGYITQFEVFAVPEPHTFAFFTLSTVGMFVLLRRRKRLNFN